jgi:hypothetical protein
VSASNAAEPGDDTSSSLLMMTSQPSLAAKGDASKAARAASMTAIPPFMSAVPGPFNVSESIQRHAWNA